MKPDRMSANRSFDSKPGPSLQRGAVLLVSLILMVLLTIFVLSAILTANVNLRIVGNTQSRTEAMAAAQQGVEQVVSTNFPDNPVAVTVDVDINGDGVKDYTVNVQKPTCQNMVPIKTVDLDIINKPLDRQCNISPVLEASGIVGAPAGNSQCSNSQWEVEAKVSDTAKSGVKVDIVQGIAERVRTGTSC